MGPVTIYILYDPLKYCEGIAAEKLLKGICDAHLLAGRRISVLAYDMMLVMRKVPGQLGQLIRDVKGFFGHCVMGMML
jgi:hypothetical protein